MCSDGLRKNCGAPPVNRAAASRLASAKNNGFQFLAKGIFHAVRAISTIAPRKPIVVNEKLSPAWSEKCGSTGVVVAALGVRSITKNAGGLKNAAKQQAAINQYGGFLES